MDNQDSSTGPGTHAEKEGIALSQITVGDVNGNFHIGHITGYTAEQVAEIIAKISTNFDPKPYKGSCPYKGLDMFEEEDAGNFFGRSKLVTDLVGLVQKSRAVFITGASGSGKSSLVRAGLIPALRSGALEEEHSNRWLFATLTPGRQPLEALAGAFSRLKTPELGKYFRENLSNPDVLIECANSVLGESKHQRLVLFLDQFEECFTQVAREEERGHLFDLLARAATFADGRLILLFCMRSDFIPNFAAYPKLNQLLNQTFFQIGVMEEDELVSAIAQPSLNVGLPIGPDLVAEIMNDMQGEPGALPLMQFAMKDLFDAQKKEHGASGIPGLTRQDYLNRGGIRQALNRHADQIFADLNTEEQTLARFIFSGLVKVGTSPQQDTRRNAFLRELVPTGMGNEDVRVVIHKLADARLVTTSTNESTGEIAVTISHEKLISAWSWLSKLVNDNRESILIQNEIMNDANEWEEHQRDESFLYRGARLAKALEKLQMKQLVLSGLALEFVEAGDKAYTDQLEAERRRADQLDKLNQTVLTRQLVAQAQSLIATRNSKQVTAVLLAMQSMKIIQSSDAAQILLNNNFSAPALAQFAHEGHIWAVDFSSDGRYVASGGLDHTARVWDVATGAEISRAMHNDEITHVSFSPDGRYVASGGRSNTLLIWDASNGREVGRISCGRGIRDLVFSRDGKYIAFGGEDKTARVYEVARNREIVSLDCADTVISVAFSPDGRYVATGGADHTARLWEMARKKEISRIAHEADVWSVAFSPDGKYVASAGHNTIRVWEASKGREVARMTHNSNVSTVAFSPNGKYLASGSSDKTARVWDALNGREIARMTHDGPISRVRFSSDSGSVVSSSWDQTARVWEATTGREVARMTHASVVRAAAFSPDGKYVVSGGEDKTAQVWEVQTVRQNTHMSFESAVKSAAFSPDGCYIAFGNEDNTLRIWEVASGKVIARMAHSQPSPLPVLNFGVSSVAFSPDSKYVVSIGIDKTARLWEAATGKEIRRLVHDEDISSVNFSPDGSLIVTESGFMATNSVRVWDVATGKEISRRKHDPLKFVFSVSFSPDSKYVAAGNADQTASVWEARTGTEVARMLHRSMVSGVAFSPDGKCLATASGDKTARVWEIASGREVVRVPHNDAVNCVAFSPDNRLVISGSDDHTARIWETDTGSEIGRITHDGPVTRVLFSPDGIVVLTSSKDNTARISEAASGQEVIHVDHDGQAGLVSFSPDGRFGLSVNENNTVNMFLWKPEDLMASACATLPRNLTRAEWRHYIGEVLPFQPVCENLPVEPEEVVVPAASEAQPMSMMEEIISFMGREMGYEITQLENGMIRASHEKYLSLFVGEYPFGFLFSALMSVPPQMKRGDILRFINEANSLLSVSRCYLKENDTLILEASIPATYERSAFLQFLAQLNAENPFK